MQPTEFKEIMEKSPDTMQMVTDFSNQPFDLSREEAKSLNALTEVHELAIISDTQGDSLQLKTLNALQEISLNNLNLGDAFEDIGSIQDIEIQKRESRKFTDELKDRTSNKRDGNEL